MTGKFASGFTLIELLLVLMLISLLASLAMPVVSRSIERARESALKEDLFVIRDALDDYYADKGRYPPDLETLAVERYLRKVPHDPLTNGEWVLVFQDDPDGHPGIIDLKSSSDVLATDGTKYSEW